MKKLIATSIQWLLFQTWSNAPHPGPSQYEKYTQNMNTVANKMLKEPEHLSCE